MLHNSVLSRMGFELVYLQMSSMMQNQNFKNYKFNRNVCVYVCVHACMYMWRKACERVCACVILCSSLWIVLLCSTCTVHLNFSFENHSTLSCMERKKQLISWTKSKRWRQVSDLGERGSHGWSKASCPQESRGTLASLPAEATSPVPPRCSGWGPLLSAQRPCPSSPICLPVPRKQNQISRCYQHSREYWTGADICTIVGLYLLQ